MVLKLHGPVRTHLLDIALQVVLVTHRATAAIAGEITQYVGVGDGEAVGFFHLWRRILDEIRQRGLGRQAQFLLGGSARAGTRADA